MAAPEFFASYPVASRRTLGWKDEKSLHYLETKAFFEAAHIKVATSFSAVPLGALVEIPPTLMWEHQGRCQCGRRSYLFGQCSKCLKEEMLEKAAEEQRRLEEEEPLPPTVEMDPGPSGGQDLPSVLRSPMKREGSSTESVDFLTSRDVLDVLQGNGIARGWAYRTATWKPGQQVILPSSPRPDSPYRMCFAVEADSSVVPLQQCVDYRSEKDHGDELLSRSGAVRTDLVLP